MWRFQIFTVVMLIHAQLDEAFIPSSFVGLRMSSIKANQDEFGSSNSYLALKNSKKLLVRTWKSDQNPPLGAALIVHGFGWHSGYFAPLATVLNAKGYDVVSYDLPGHGLSEGDPRGFIGRFKDAVDITDALLADAITAVVERRPADASPPVAIVAGESMGGLIALQLLRRTARKAGPNAVRGLLLLGPVVRVSQAVLPPKPVVAFIRLLSRFFPLLEVPDDSIRDGFEQAFGDSAFARRAKADPLVMLQRSRLGMVAEVLGTCEDLCRNMEEVGGSETNMLILHGEVDSRTELTNSRELVGRAGAAVRRLEVLEQGNHMLLYDRPDITQRSLQLIGDWAGKLLGA